jgi:membrane protease YdiL (CAAX protease family)
VNLPPDDLPDNPGEPVWGRAPSPVQAEQRSATAGGQSDAAFASAVSGPSDEKPAALVPAAPPDPAWTGWDVLRLTFFAIVALFVGVFAVLLIARWQFYPPSALRDVGRVPLVIIAGQCAAYLLILAYMYVLVTRERRRPDFLNAVHWNFPSRPFPYLLRPFWFVTPSLRARFPRAVAALSYLLLGFVLSVALQGLAHLLPIPKELPIDEFFRTPAEAWALSILSVALAPLMEELYFRGFLYPVLARSIEMAAASLLKHWGGVEDTVVLSRNIAVSAAILLTAAPFALLHGGQLKFAWGPVLLIFLVGLVLTAVRAQQNSVAACVLVHMAYNGTIAVAMFAATGGFRHLERLSSQ